MKVLETVHGLEVKDIRTFVDWLKTFRVELEGGGKLKYWKTIKNSRCKTFMCGIGRKEG